MTKKRYFGTDGVRGPAGQGKLSSRSLLALAQATAQYFDENGSGTRRAVLGRDTRSSGHMMESALIAGLTEMGITCESAGVLPSAALSYVTRERGADFGLMITASHNPHTDNGIKLFDSKGEKLEDSAQTEIESIMLDRDGWPDVKMFGHTRGLRGARQDYETAVVNSVDPDVSLAGLKIVLDCANGAGYETAPDILTALGADNLILIGNEPNGENINLGCGSTHSENLTQRVLSEKADLGIALDGDADRLIMCDEQGREVDGDQILALLAMGWKSQDKLRQPAIAATLMSNLGLERFLGGHGIELIRTNVGDRYVASAMREHGLNMGGEQSGHVLMTDYLPTGDGTLAAVQVLAEFVRLGGPASQALRVFEPVPQLLKNVRYDGASPLQNDRVKAAIKAADAALTNGRILVRASGTEPLIRVMAEGDDAAAIDKVVSELVDIIAQA